MTLLPAVAIAVIVTWALGGAMSRLTALSFRATGAIYAALAAQIVIFSPLAGGNESVVRVGQLASYVLILVFLVLNTRIRGMSVIAFGVAANTLAIAANGGLMPVDPGRGSGVGMAARSVGGRDVSQHRPRHRPHAPRLPRRHHRAAGEPDQRRDQRRRSVALRGRVPGGLPRLLLRGACRQQSRRAGRAAAPTAPSGGS